MRKGFFLQKIGLPIYNFINNGGWITCIIVGILGILLSMVGMFSTLIDIYKDEDYFTFVFVGSIDLIVLIVLVFSSIKIAELIKNNKDIFNT